MRCSRPSRSPIPVTTRYAHSAALLTFRAADHPARQMSMPEESAFFPRLYVAMYTTFATLRATLPARSIYDDLDGVTEPVTPLGKQHHTWVRDAACRADWTIMTTPSTNVSRMAHSRLVIAHSARMPSVTRRIRRRAWSPDTNSRHKENPWQCPMSSLSPPMLP